MRDVSVMVNGKLQGLPVKDVKKLVLSAFEKAESTGESKMEFESRFEKHTIVIKKG